MKKIFLIQLILFSVIAFGQAPTRFYTKFGGNGVDIGYSGKPTLDKQYIITGSTSSYGAGNTDVYLIKVDSMGYSLWEKTFGGFNNDVGKSVVQLPDSGYVIAGFTNSFGAGGYDIYLIRTDKNGNLIWQKTFGGSDWDFANDVVLTPDGDIAVVGNTNSFGHGKKDGLFLKYDYSGNLVQQKYIGGVENEELRSIIVTSDYFLAAVGYTESSGDLNGDCYFVKLDLLGDTMFTRCFGGPDHDYLNDIVLKFDGNFVMCGAKTYTTNTKTQSLICDFTSSGVFQWENHYYASSTDEAFVSLANSKEIPYLTANLRTVPVPAFKLDGNVFITGYMGYYYNANSFCGPEDEILYSIESMPDGGYVCIGSTLSFGSIGEDVFMIKLDSSMIAYSNVVEVKENKKVDKPLMFYDDDTNLEIVFQNIEIPNLIEILDLNGKKLKQFFPNETKLKINLFDLPSAIYIMKAKNKNGTFYNMKIIRR